jgi:hypothetical protein
MIVGSNNKLVVNQATMKAMAQAWLEDHHGSERRTAGRELGPCTCHRPTNSRSCIEEKPTGQADGMGL